MNSTLENTPSLRAVHDALQPAWMMADTQSVTLRRAPPAVTYIIACAPRTGSYLLCEGLEATEVAGRPTESLSSDYRYELCKQLYGEMTSFSKSVATVVRHGMTSNRVFGAKLHWGHVEYIALEADYGGPPFAFLRREFADARYIHLFRRDAEAQAISLHRAHQTEEWWRIEGIENPYRKAVTPTFDASEILRLENEMIRQRRAWEDFFQQERISPLRMEYENLAFDYRYEVGKALQFLGQDPAIAYALPKPRMQRQSDELNLLWKQKLAQAKSRRKAWHTRSKEQPMNGGSDAFDPPMSSILAVTPARDKALESNPSRTDNLSRKRAKIFEWQR
jgi:LPS sulfotransferase NodH